MKTAYLAWLEKMRAAARPLVEYACPTCDDHLASLLPPVGDTYSTMVQCPFCGQLHFRVVRADGTILVDGEVTP